VYCYVYDELLQDRRYERDLALVETRLTDLGIAGKIARLALFRNAVELIRDEIRTGANTIVAVGNDKTLRKALDAVGDSKTVVALLPIGPQGIMAGLLGMPTGVAACDVLSARIIEELDVGEVNGRRFVQAVTFEPDNYVVHMGRDFTLTPLRKSALEVRNLAEPDDAGVQSPVDGRLSLIQRLTKFSLMKKKADIGIVPFKECFVQYAETVTALVDGEAIEGRDFAFRVVPKMLRVVTGRTRKF
jgi:diacylglycerol kinase family enzyme